MPKGRATKNELRVDPWHEHQLELIWNLLSLVSVELPMIDSPEYVVKFPDGKQSYILHICSTAACVLKVSSCQTTGFRVAEACFRPRPFYLPEQVHRSHRLGGLKRQYEELLHEAKPLAPSIHCHQSRSAIPRSSDCVDSFALGFFTDFSLKGQTSFFSEMNPVSCVLTVSLLKDDTIWLVKLKVRVSIVSLAKVMICMSIYIVTK